MTGEKVRDILQAHKVKPADLARLIGTLPQNVNSKLNAKDVASSFIEDILRVTNIPLSAFFPDYYNAEHTTRIAAEPKTPYSGADEQQDFQQAIAELKQELDNLKKQVGKK